LSSWLRPIPPPIHRRCLFSQALTSTDLQAGNQIELGLAHTANATTITGTFEVLHDGSVIDSNTGKLGHARAGRSSSTA